MVALGDDALSFDVPGTGDGANVVVESNSRDVRVNAMIIDPTGAIVSSFFIQDNTPDGETH